MSSNVTETKSGIRSTFDDPSLRSKLNGIAILLLMLGIAVRADMARAVEICGNQAALTAAQQKHGSTSCWIPYWHADWRGEQIEASHRTLRRVADQARIDDPNLVPTIDRVLEELGKAEANDGAVFFFDWYPDLGQPHNKNCGFYLRTAHREVGDRIYLIPSDCDEQALSFKWAFQSVLDQRSAFAAGSLEKYILSGYPDPAVQKRFIEADTSNVSLAVALSPTPKVPLAWFQERYEITDVLFPTGGVFGVESETTYQILAKQRSGSAGEWPTLLEINRSQWIDASKVQAGVKLFSPPIIEEWAGFKVVEGLGQSELAQIAAEEVYGDGKYTSFARWVIDRVSQIGQPKEYFFPVFSEGVIDFITIPVVLLKR